MEKGVNKHAGSGNWQAMAFSHAPLEEHLPSLQASGAGLGASLAMQPAQHNGPPYFLNPMNIAVAAEEARKRAKAASFTTTACTDSGSVLDSKTLGADHLSTVGESATSEAVIAGTSVAAAEGEDSAVTSSAASEAKDTTSTTTASTGAAPSGTAASSSNPALPPSINSYVYDPKLAQAVWDQESKASEAAVDAAEQASWPVKAEVLYLTADGEEELNEVPWHPGIV